MERNFSAVEEIRKHPGISLGTLAAVVLGVSAAIYLNQRSGPTRYERIRERMDPRGWIDTDRMNDRFHDAWDAVRHGADVFGERAGDYAHGARHQADNLYRKARGKFRKTPVKPTHFAQRYVEDASNYARDHAREGGILLAVATVAAIVGAVAIESRREDSAVRKFGRF